MKASDPGWLMTPTTSPKLCEVCISTWHPELFIYLFIFFVLWQHEQHRNLWDLLVWKTFSLWGVRSHFVSLHRMAAVEDKSSPLCPLVFKSHTQKKKKTFIGGYCVCVCMCVYVCVSLCVLLLWRSLGVLLITLPVSCGAPFVRTHTHTHTHRRGR